MGMRAGWVLSVLCGFGLTLSPAAACRQALVLAVDVSASVSAQEYALQRDGIAAALRDEEVADWILGPRGAEVEIFIFEFGSRNYQWFWVDWTKITSAAVLTEVADKVSGITRNADSQSTGIGNALLAGVEALGSRRCAVKTIDVSGDGKNNVGTPPEDVRRQLANTGVTVNALVIATQDVAELTAYFNAHVIHGPQAFVETAIGFEDYARAMKRKLLRELVPKLAMVSP